MTSAMSIEVELWGPLRQAHPGGRVTLLCSPDATAVDVRRAAASVLSTVADIVRVSAVATATRVLQDDEPIGGEVRLVLLPPVSGG